MSFAETLKSAVEKWEYGTKTPTSIAQEGALARLRKTMKRPKRKRKKDDT